MKSISGWKVLMDDSRGQESHSIWIQTKLRERTKRQLTGNDLHFVSLFKEISFFMGSGVLKAKMYSEIVPFSPEICFPSFSSNVAHQSFHKTESWHFYKQLCFSFKIISLRILFNCVLLKLGTKHVIGRRKWPMGLNIYHSLIQSTKHFFYFVLYLSNIQKWFFMEFSRKLFSYFV